MEHAEIYFDFQRKKVKTEEQRAGVERAIKILRDKICGVGADQKRLENVGSFLGWWNHYFFHIFE
jgi:hypothetical protein